VEYESCLDFGEIYVPSRDGSVQEMDEFCYKMDIYSDSVSFVFPVRPQGFSFLGSACWRSGGTFRRNKTIEAVEHRFYWLIFKRDIAKIVGQCHTCQLSNKKNRLPVLTLLSLCPVARVKT